MSHVDRVKFRVQDGNVSILGNTSKPFEFEKEWVRAEDYDDAFRAGFEAAKNAAIQCARQSEHWNLFEARGCKAVQHSIEFMQMLDANRFNHDGTMKPEPTVEYDREKHGPIVNGRVKLP